MEVNSVLFWCKVGEGGRAEAHAGSNEPCLGWFVKSSVVGGRVKHSQGFTELFMLEKTREVVEVSRE